MSEDKLCESKNHWAQIEPMSQRTKVVLNIINRYFVEEKKQQNKFLAQKTKT